MDIDIKDILWWIIIGVGLLIAASIVGLLIDLGTALLSIAIKVLVIVLVVALIVRAVEGVRTRRT